MHRLWRTWSLGLIVLGALSRPASAEGLGPTKIFLSVNEQTPLFSFLTLGDGTSAGGKRAGFDYAVFAAELAAYVTKEVLNDSAEEYRDSPLGSRLSRDMPAQRSEFGSHCLTIVTQLRSALPSMPGSVAVEDTPNVVDYAVRTGTALLVVRQIWSAFRNDIENTRSGFSLNPKVSARKVGINLTFHW
jgi:hypothetical protein